MAAFWKTCQSGLCPAVRSDSPVAAQLVSAGPRVCCFTFPRPGQRLSDAFAFSEERVFPVRARVHRLTDSRRVPFRFQSGSLAGDEVKPRIPRRTRSVCAEPPIGGLGGEHC